MDLYIKEREGKPNADCQSRSPMPSTSGEPSSVPSGQARPSGASEADRGKRGWWGQARPMGAVSRRAKSIVNTPPLAQGFPDEVKQNQRNKRKSKILLRVPNRIKSKSKENPSIQCKSKYTI